MHALCIQCAKALLLKSLIAESSIYAPCNVCGTPGLQVIDTSDLKFIRAIKALIRYHYSEWEYHGRLGGESFQHLLSIENPIIRLNPKLDEIEYEEFLLSFYRRSTPTIKFLSSLRMVVTSTTTHLFKLFHGASRLRLPISRAS